MFSLSLSSFEASYVILIGIEKSQWKFIEMQFLVYRLCSAVCTVHPCETWLALSAGQSTFVWAMLTMTVFGRPCHMRLPVTSRVGKKLWNKSKRLTKWGWHQVKKQEVWAILRNKKRAATNLREQHKQKELCRYQRAEMNIGSCLLYTSPSPRD